MLKSKFPYNLKELRESVGLSQTELSKKIDVSRATLSNYESGQSEPVLCNLIKLAEFFNCSIDELVFGCNSQKNLNSISYNTYSIQLSNILDQLERINLDKIISNVKLIKNDFDNNSLQNSVSKLNTKVDFAENISYKTEIAEETFPVISLGKYKSSKNSIDVDFYRNNGVKIFASYYSKKNNKNLVAIPFCGDVSCGALKYMSEHLSEYFYLYSNDLRYDGSEYFILQVDGESMNKLYKNGDFLLVKKTNCFDSCNKPYVFYFDDSATLKYIELSEEILRLIPHSTKHYTQKILTFEELQYMQHGVVGTIEGVLNFIED